MGGRIGSRHMVLARPVPRVREAALGDADPRLRGRDGPHIREEAAQVLRFGVVKHPHGAVEVELRLKIFPVVLGAGQRLFGQISDNKPMRLAGTQTLEGGVAFLTHERVRDAAR